MPSRKRRSAPVGIQGGKKKKSKINNNKKTMVMIKAKPKKRDELDVPFEGYFEEGHNNYVYGENDLNRACKMLQGTYVKDGRNKCWSAKWYYGRVVQCTSRICQETRLIQRMHLIKFRDGDSMWYDIDAAIRRNAFAFLNWNEVPDNEIGHEIGDGEMVDIPDKRRPDLVTLIKNDDEETYKPEDSEDEDEENGSINFNNNNEIDDDDKVSDATSPPEAIESPTDNSKVLDCTEATTATTNTTIQQQNNNRLTTGVGIMFFTHTTPVEPKNTITNNSKQTTTVEEKRGEEEVGIQQEIAVNTLVNPTLPPPKKAFSRKTATKSTTPAKTNNKDEQECRYPTRGGGNNQNDKVTQVTPTTPKKRGRPKKKVVTDVNDNQNKSPKNKKLTGKAYLCHHMCGRDPKTGIIRPFKYLADKYGEDYVFKEYPHLNGVIPLPTGRTNKKVTPKKKTQQKKTVAKPAPKKKTQLNKTVAGQTTVGKNKIQTTTKKRQPKRLLVSPTKLIESVRLKRYSLPTRKSARISK